MQVPGKIFLMVNTLSMHREKMWWQESVLHNRLPKKVQKDGLSWPMSRRKNGKQNTQALKKICPLYIKNWMKYNRSLRIITKTCRTWNLQYRRENFGSCRPAMAKGPELLWLRFQWTCSEKVR